MTNDEKILKAIQALQADMTIVKEDVKTVDWKVEAFNKKLDVTKEELIKRQDDLLDQISYIITAAALQKHVDKLENRVKALEAELASVKSKN
jgi:predicted  nucleic acid-binding Zn-ribbon protein